MLVRRRSRISAALRSADGSFEAEDDPLHDLPVVALRHGAPEGLERDRGDQARTRPAEGVFRLADEAGRSTTHRAADTLRSRDDERDRLLQRNRKLFTSFVGTRGRPAAADADRLFAAQRVDVHRRKPRHRAAGRRHVPRGSCAQGEPRQLRIPVAVRVGQPPLTV